MNWTGGFFYHLRAFRFRKSLWGDHERAVARFLSEWNPKQKKILLIGCSAGYSIPDSFLEKFNEVHAIEPDSLSRFLFNQSHTKRVRWIEGTFSYQDFITRSESLQDTAILFCNLLGQIPVPNREFRERFLSALSRLEWASYHDFVSASGVEFDTELHEGGKASISQVKNWVYLKQGASTQVVLNDHGTDSLFPKAPGLKFKYWQWRIIPKYSHLVEGVFR